MLVRSWRDCDPRAASWIHLDGYPSAWSRAVFLLIRLYIIMRELWGSALKGRRGQACSSTFRVFACGVIFNSARERICFNLLRPPVCFYTTKRGKPAHLIRCDYISNVIPFTVNLTEHRFFLRSSIHRALRVLVVFFFLVFLSLFLPFFSPPFSPRSLPRSWLFHDSRFQLAVLARAA